MKEAKEDGGQAFPYEHKEWDTDDREWRTHFVHGGMTLRDYAAIHSTQPGMVEICLVARVRQEGSRVFLSADDSVGQYFDDWFRSLGLQRICELSAMVRYAQADAMLKARQQ